MIPQLNYHLELDEGADYSHVFTIRDPDTNIPEDLTGYTARMDVRGLEYNSQSSVIITVSYDSVTSTASRGLILGGTSGTVTLSIPSSDTTSGSWYGGTKGTYDIFLTDSTGKKTKFVKGFFTINPSTTVVV